MARSSLLERSAASPAASDRVDRISLSLFAYCRLNWTSWPVSCVASRFSPISFPRRARASFLVMRTSSENVGRESRARYSLNRDRIDCDLEATRCLALPVILVSTREHESVRVTRTLRCTIYLLLNIYLEVRAAHLLRGVDCKDHTTCPVLSAR